ncbi:hypothetical protein SK069_18680 [Patulibacter brassicae]|uniref:Uncharacterized protein n=1 Tax=Patulibacter brassicae TaxID=1705717 RepID=A0ABU4VQ88_9ACTN|nr:hypothetical protein [Patulibacter brassicae]MDX8153630.1 hypothetical protein [Patulibacter brassicae]
MQTPGSPRPSSLPCHLRPLGAVLAAGGAALALSACGGSTTTTVVVVQTTPPPATTPSTPTSTATVPTTPTVATAEVPSPTVPTVATAPTRPTRTATQRRLEASAEKTVRNFYAALRSRDVSAVCSLLTTGTVQRFGGRANCKNGRYVRSSAATGVPRSSHGLRFTTLLTNRDRRAVVLVRAGGRRYAVRLARQGGQWRVAGSRRFGS